jgi:galactokinase/mevalonate kinase-like predicted kinase
MQILLSLPPTLVDSFAELENRSAPTWIAGSDPAGSKLGSGGGTAHLLATAWQTSQAHAEGSPGFQQWLDTSRKLIIHAGGQSRRLPAYAANGKVFAPMPVFRWSKGQRLDQSLLDLQLPFYQNLLSQAPESYRTMVTSGDVLIRNNAPLPPLPEVDVLCLGLWVSPEQASHHGAFFCKHQSPEELAFFLQKPAPERIRELAPEYLFMIDLGVWLFSAKALDVLMRKCGWNADSNEFRGGQASLYELYAEFGLGLGNSPTSQDPEVNALTSAVLPLPQGQFYHFGTNRELIHSSALLQDLVTDQRETGRMGIKPRQDIFTLNALTERPLSAKNHTLWVDNSFIPASWQLAHEHVLTGIPENHWTLSLQPGQCLDLVPVAKADYCLRFYGIDDPFRGSLNAPATEWLGQPIANWFSSRGLSLGDLGIPADTDIQEVPLFPVLSDRQLQLETDPPAEKSAGRAEAFLQWLLDAGSACESDAERFRQLWLESPRLSAAQLGEKANLKRLYQQRRTFRHRLLKPLAENFQRNIFYRLDLEATAADYAQTEHELPTLPSLDSDLMQQVHARMFQAAVCRHRNQSSAAEFEQDAFQILREAIIEPMREAPVLPSRHVLDDQIVWGRSPVRLDLAGGWTDTPPYCLMNGGKVVNLAVELNGQPPVQVFAKVTERPDIVLRSIDLGVAERLSTYEELRGYNQVGSGFVILKAALALAGFLPEFCSQKYPSLKEQLHSFGGGLEISLLAAIPKGSGLGTSSVLSATVLGTLSDVCGLRWDHRQISRRTLVLEQMLTTGGGWQDQLGGLTRGLKLIETQPGLDQTPLVRWLPTYLFTNPETRNCVLLYYTGITRVAKHILQDIVRGMFLNNQQHLGLLADLADHAGATYETLLREDWDDLCRMVRRSWQLNQALDAGTNPPAVQAILAKIDEYLAGMKLLGAGGGGYMLMMAKDADAAGRIRRILQSNPPNPRARFVDVAISETGLQITRS